MRSASDDESRILRRVRVESSVFHIRDAKRAIFGLLYRKYADSTLGGSSKIDNDMFRECEGGLTRHTKRFHVRRTQRASSTVRHHQLDRRAENFKFTIDAVANLDVLFPGHVDDLFLLYEAHNFERACSLRAYRALRESEEMRGNFRRRRRSKRLEISNVLFVLALFSDDDHFTSVKAFEAYVVVACSTRGSVRLRVLSSQAYVA